MRKALSYEWRRVGTDPVPSWACFSVDDLSLIHILRRLAYEAADSGLLSPELAAGIRRVKGVKQLGARTGNWLTRDQAGLLLEKADGDDLRSLRDLAMISILLGCGLRRAELSALTVADMQIRQGHWAIVDLVGKGCLLYTSRCV